MLYAVDNPHGGDIYKEKVLLDFSANTNPYGTPKGVLAAIEGALKDVHRYPDPYCRSLVQAIASFEGVSETYIFCGNGAADLIFSYCEAVRPRTAIELAPTFSEYTQALQRTGCVVERFFLDQEHSFLLTEEFLRVLEKKNTDAVFLCNPNNPTGRTIPPALLEEILALCTQKNIHLFLDECFMDLADVSYSMKDAVAAHPNLFILKAFTKSYGMAGIRLGYAICSNVELLKRMGQGIQPWNVSLLAQVAGVAALKEQNFLERTRSVVQVERRWLCSELRAFGFTVCESEANYILFRAPLALDESLRRQHIAIRSCANYHGLGKNWYRIAVRLHEENEMLVSAIKTIAGER